VQDVLPLLLGIRVPMSVCSAAVGRGAVLREVGAPGLCGGIVETGGQGEALGRWSELKGGDEIREGGGWEKQISRVGGLAPMF
jgi:hypothetical protein